ncbi:MAG TPA: chaperone modulator CbpM [Puia sp.]|nr:chaperone modulator CbpM [Puia sp.]
MNKANSISVEQCCFFYRVEASFIQSLEAHGLLEITQFGDQRFISHDQLGELEKYMHFFYELQINMEGLEAISHLLHRVKHLQGEIKRLQNLIPEMYPR